jgi:hypothetical protein
VHLENGRDLVINAPGNSPSNSYVQGLTVDGEPWASTSLPHDLLAGGAVLDFAMGPEPSAWGTGAPPPSLNGGGPPRPLMDIARSGRCSDGTDAAPLFDDTTRTEVRFASPAPTVTSTAGAPRTVRLYTLTSAALPGDPVSWVLEGSTEGTAWTVLDERRDEEFRWRRQTRPFRIAEPGAYRHHRLRITAATRRRVRLAQWELLAEAEGAQ